MSQALMSVYSRSEIAPVRGKGVYLFDAAGRCWLDFASGIAVNSIGHCHPHLTRAIRDQSARLIHVSNLYTIPVQQTLAERLVERSFADAVLFTNSGAEALECAIKTARRRQFVMGHPERYRIVTFANAFHGRTLATIAATDQVKLRDGFEPLPDWFDVAPFNDLAAVEKTIGRDTAAILVEPVQGEGGIRPANPEFLNGLRTIADRHQISLIFDEVQCGIGRTGTLFAYQTLGVTPDIMALAKGLGGGFPLGACLATYAAAQGMTVGTHGSTYGGNPLAMAAGHAVLDIVDTPEMTAHVDKMSGKLCRALQALVEQQGPPFLEVRGIGLMLGLRLSVPSRAFVDHARDFGILTVAAGDNVMRILPPLIIDENHIDEFVYKLGAAAQAYTGAAP